MNATAAPARRPTSPPQLPALPRRQRIGAAVASAVVSSVLLSAVVLGLTGSPDGASELAERPAPTARA